MVFCDGVDEECDEVTYCFDHIIPLSGPGDERFYEVAGIAPLCQRHHTLKTIRFDGGFGHKPDMSESGAVVIERMLERARQRAEAIEERGA